ncbi:hypothetical protein NMY22_g14264 [Coprinellus aureogranulatus]|nr:hypothetical protein NMY22_g14264 [Coprinellus aureogranulatus]
MPIQQFTNVMRQIPSFKRAMDLSNLPTGNVGFCYSQWRSRLSPQMQKKVPYVMAYWNGNVDHVGETIDEILASDLSPTHILVLLRAIPFKEEAQLNDANHRRIEIQGGIGTGQIGAQTLCCHFQFVVLAIRCDSSLVLTLNHHNLSGTLCRMGNYDEPDVLYRGYMIPMEKWNEMMKKIPAYRRLMTSTYGEHNHTYCYCHWKMTVLDDKIKNLAPKIKEHSFTSKDPTKEGSHMMLLVGCIRESDKNALERYIKFFQNRGVKDLKPEDSQWGCSVGFNPIYITLDLVLIHFGIELYDASKTQDRARMDGCSRCNLVDTNFTVYDFDKRMRDATLKVEIGRSKAYFLKLEPMADIASSAYTAVHNAIVLHGGVRIDQVRVQLLSPLAPQPLPSPRPARLTTDCTMVSKSNKHTLQDHIYIGYAMPIQQFTDMMRKIPSFKRAMDISKLPTEDVDFCYSQWRSRLSPEMRKKVPFVMAYWNGNPDDVDLEVGDSADAVLAPDLSSTHVLVLLRAIPFKEDAQLEDPNHKDARIIREEKKSDMQGRDRFVKLYQSQGAKDLKAEDFVYGWSLGSHPSLVMI